MIHVHRDLDLEPDDIVEVTLDGRANVMLLDPVNYEKYRRNESFKYHGGFADRSPFRLESPGPGRWHLAVDLGGYPGHLQAGIRLIRGQALAR